MDLREQISLMRQCLLQAWDAMLTEADRRKRLDAEMRAAIAGHANEAAAAMVAAWKRFSEPSDRAL